MAKKLQFTLWRNEKVLKDNVPRIKFVTVDGSIVMNRQTEDWVINRKNPSFDASFIPLTLQSDARRIGVKIISYEHEDGLIGVTATVQWLKSRKK